MAAEVDPLTTRKMWVLIDKDEDRENELAAALDGGLHTTKPIPAHKWLKPVRVIVTIKEVTRGRR